MNRTNTLANALAVISSAIIISMTGCNGAASTPTPAGSSSGGAESALPDVAIPTQEEADAAAAREISAENADAEFEALMREIESDTEE